jgi:hypothetical protein
VKPQTPTKRPTGRRDPTPRTRYYLVLAATAAAFVFICSTEVLDRWSQSAKRYQDILERERVTVAPESLATHRRLLKERAASLRAELDRTSGAYSRTLAGFLSQASASARAHSVRLVNVAPVRSDESLKEGELCFKLDCRGEFHQIAFLLNTLENSPLDIHITKVELSMGEHPAKSLESSIQGRFKMSEDVRRGSPQSPRLPEL